MLETRGLKNRDFTFLAVTLLSMGVHCAAAVLFMQLAGERPAVISPRAIMVDVRNLPRAEKPPSEPAHRPDGKARTRPTEEKAKALLRERPPVTAPAEAVDRPVISAATHSGSPGVREKPLPLPAYHPELSAGESLPRSAPTSMDRSEPALAAHAENAAAAYLALIRERIDRHKEYPVAARRGRLQGTVRIRCVLGKSGEVKEAVIHRSSGFGILDNAAVRAVRCSGPFPELPAGVTGDTIVFDLPVVFRLTDNAL